MTSSLEPRSQCEEIEELIGAYALGALEPSEFDLVEAHLEHCASCRESAGRAVMAVGELGWLVESVPPSPAVKDRLMASIAMESAKAPELQTVNKEPAVFRSRKNILVAALGVAAAVLLVSVAVLANQLMNVSDERDDAMSSAQLIASYVSAGGQVVPLTTQDASIYDGYKGQGSLLTAPGKDPMVVVSGCPKSNDYLSYRVWFAKGEDRSPAGTLWVHENGTGWMRLTSEEPLTSFDTVGVTAVMNDERREDVLVGPIAPPEFT